MASLLSLISIAIGALLILIGLLMIAPQVRVHQIKIYSTGSWLFRIGMIAMVIGILAAQDSDLPKQVIQVAQLMGLTGLMGGVITAGHEYRQARDHHDETWSWPRSLALQMIVAGGIVLILASAAL